MISILLPTYNGEKFISQSIDSILNQTFGDFELLIGFNGTTDNSKDIVSSYNDKRIRVFDYADEKGKSTTLNKLLLESKFDWIALQDDDDIWLETKLEKQIEFINEFDVIGTFINYIDENNQIIGRPILTSFPDDINHISMSGDNQIANSSTLIKKSVVLELNGWSDSLDKLADDGFQPCEDFDLWLRMMRVGKKFINIPEELVKHRLHKNSNFNTKKFDIKKIL